MAVDTAGKRFSLIGFGCPIPQLAWIPDGTVGDADRVDLLYLYSGFALPDAVEVDTPGAGKKRRRRKAEVRRYPRRVMVDGQVFIVNNAIEERELLLRLAAGAAEDAQILEQAQPKVAQKKRRIVRRLERRIRQTFDAEAAWQEFLASEDEEILLVLAASRVLH